MYRCVARFSLLFLMLSAGSAVASRPRQVLLLHSFNRGFSSFQAFAEEFRKQVTGGFPEEVVFYEVASQPAPSHENPDEQPTLNYLTSTFAKHHFDLVVTVGGPAAAFATKHRQELFPETPLLLAAVDERYVKNTALTANDAVVAVRNDVRGVIENIRHVLPQTSTIFLVIGNSPHEQFWRKQIDGELQQFRSQLQFVWLNDLSFPEMLKRCASFRRTQRSSTFYFPSIRKALPEPRVFHCRDFTLKQAHRSLAFIEPSWGMESLAGRSCRWMTSVRSQPALRSGY